MRYKNYFPRISNSFYFAEFYWFGMPILS